MNTFTVRLISAEQARPLRQLILRPGQPAAKSVYPMDAAPQTFHLGAFTSDEMVGVASFYREAPPEEEDRGWWRLRGMAVVSGMQGRGCGTELLREGVKRIRGRGGRKLWCNARGTAVGFCRRLGFAEEGGYFEEDGHPHVVMWRQVDRDDSQLCDEADAIIA